METVDCLFCFVKIAISQPIAYPPAANTRIVTATSSLSPFRCFIYGETLDELEVTTKIRHIFEKGASFFGQVSMTFPWLTSLRHMASTAGSAIINTSSFIIPIVSIFTLEPTRIFNAAGMRKGASIVSITTSERERGLLPL